MDMLSTFEGSRFSEAFPKGWDLKKIKDCVSNKPEDIGKRQKFWNPGFDVVPCRNLEEFGVYMGHEIAMQIRLAKEEGKQLILILPVGPMGMYKWVVYFLKSWNIDCKHVHGFNMDEWSDKDGNTLPASDPAAFQNAMENAFYSPLGKLTVPKSQRNFATRENLVAYPDKIAKLKAKGARQVVVYGIGRACHIAFWEPHFAEEYKSMAAWKKEPYRVGANLHPFTIEQNAITSFRSNWTLIPCYANTIGPGIIFGSDYAIGGADGVLSRGMQWQGVSLWMTLRYGPDKAVTSSSMPTLPGRLYFMQELAGPLQADTN